VEKSRTFSELSGSFLQIKHIEYVDQNQQEEVRVPNWLRISKHTMTFELYAKENYQKIRGYQAKHFSLMLMVDDETCKGEGSINVEMVLCRCTIACETCSGKRF
jgi:excinuclease ABC subunit A